MLLAVAMPTPARNSRICFGTERGLQRVVTAAATARYIQGNYHIAEHANPPPVPRLPKPEYLPRSAFPPSSKLGHRLRSARQHAGVLVRAWFRCCFFRLLWLMLVLTPAYLVISRRPRHSTRKKGCRKGYEYLRSSFYRINVGLSASLAFRLACHSLSLEVSTWPSQLIFREELLVSTGRAICCAHRCHRGADDGPGDSC